MQTDCVPTLDREDKSWQSRKMSLGQVAHQFWPFLTTADLFQRAPPRKPFFPLPRVRDADQFIPSRLQHTLNRNEGRAKMSLKEEGLPSPQLLSPCHLGRMTGYGMVVLRFKKNSPLIPWCLPSIGKVWWGQRFLAHPTLQHPLEEEPHGATSHGLSFLSCILLLWYCRNSV